MMRARSRNRRSGFTLLEVLLATVIGIMLLGGLYVTFEMVLKQSDAGRTAVERGDLSRAIVNRMTLDLSGSLGPLPPKSGGGLPPESTNINSGSAASSSSSSSSSSSTTAGTEGTTGTEGSTETETTTTEMAVAADVPFQGGVFGSGKQLTLYVSRVPTDLLDVNSAAQTALGGDPKPDLRRISYYLGATGGLCRQEQFLVTADGVRNSTDPDYTRETVDLIAEEVIDVNFEYYDGGSWSSTWAGDEENSDGKTVKGPPRAIKMTMVIVDDGGNQKTVEHVFAIRAAVGTFLPPLPPEDTTTTTEGM